MSIQCIICSHTEFDVILDYQNKKAVTSDNKVLQSSFVVQQCKRCFHIQKKVDKNFLDNLETIYKNYQSYALNEGKEEKKLTKDNKSTNRSQMILEYINEILPSKGKLLDIGTGTGVFLDEFSKYYDWKLYAQDVNTTNKKTLQKIKNFQDFFIFKEDKIPEKYFDVISAIHVFEHVIEINGFLDNMKKSLTKNGFLLLQVPDINNNIYDIFTIDHISHFNQYILHNLLQKKFKYVYFPKKQISREITVIATDSPISCFGTNKSIDIKVNITNKVNNLIHYLENIDEKIAIFGTSPTALFCAAVLNFNITYFLDENIDKHNKKLYERKILCPTKANEDIAILFPYSNDVLNIIEKKYPKLNFISLESLI